MWMKFVIFEDLYDDSCDDRMKYLREQCYDAHEAREYTEEESKYCVEYGLIRENMKVLNDNAEQNNNAVLL